MTLTEIARAAQLLRAGELVAFPTETVYGLGADARNPAAIAKIFAAKGRPADHPLIVHLPDATHLEQWATDISAAARTLAAACWPGPLTLILRRHPSVPDLITGGQDTVGVRVPSHPLALALLREFNGGVAAPSANRFGRISPTTAAHVREELGAAVAMVLDGGACAVGIESTIIDMTSATPRILRAGNITATALGAVLGRQVSYGADGSAATGPAPRVSGSLAAHYAPRTPLRLVASDHLANAAASALAAGQRIAVLAAKRPAPAHGRLTWQAASTDAMQFAHDLYAHLRTLDALNADLILVAAPPDGEAWRAASDRLHRAAAGSGAA